MSEVVIYIEKDYLKNLKLKTSISSNTNLIKQALSLLNWAVDEHLKGNLIVSYNSKTPDRLYRPTLSCLSEKHK